MKRRVYKNWKNLSSKEEKSIVKVYESGKKPEEILGIYKIPYRQFYKIVRDAYYTEIVLSKFRIA